MEYWGFFLFFVIPCLLQDCGYMARFLNKQEVSVNQLFILLYHFISGLVKFNFFLLLCLGHALHPGGEIES